MPVRLTEKCLVDEIRAQNCWKLDHDLSTNAIGRRRPIHRLPARLPKIDLRLRIALSFGVASPRILKPIETNDLFGFRWTTIESCGCRLSKGIRSLYCFDAIEFMSCRRRIHVDDYVEPLGKRILIRKDGPRQKTRGGIVLPDQSEIPTITGRIVEISVQIERDLDFPILKYDKVLFHPKNAIPVDFEADNLLYVVPIEDIVAVFRRVETPVTKRKKRSKNADVDEDFDAEE